MTRASVPANRLWLLFGGFTLWAAAFATLYGLNAVGCQAGWHEIGAEPFTLQRLILIALFLVGVTAIALLVRHIQRLRNEGSNEGASRFLHSTGMVATLAAGGVSILTFAPIFALGTCV